MAHQARNFETTRKLKNFSWSSNKKKESCFEQKFKLNDHAKDDVNYYYIAWAF